MVDKLFFVFVFFSFSTLYLSLHCLLASIISNEKSANNLIENPLYVMNHVLRAGFVFFFTFFDTTSPGWEWVICMPAAFLGSLSGFKP